MQNNEERCPLLLVFAEDGTLRAGDQRTIFVERGRTIASGANAVFAKWPSHLATCWSMILLMVATIGMLLAITMVLAVFGHLSAVTSSNAFLKHAQECHSNRTRRSLIGEDNYTVYLVHTEPEWSKNQMELLDKIVDNFRNARVVLLNFDKRKQSVLKPAAAETTSSSSSFYSSPSTGNDDDYEEMDVSAGRTSSSSSSEEETAAVATTGGGDVALNSEADVKKTRPRPGSLHRLFGTHFFDISIGNRKLMDLYRRKKKEHYERVLQSRKSRMNSTAAAAAYDGTNMTTTTTATTMGTFAVTDIDNEITLEDVLKKHRNCRLVNTTYEKFFRLTPLEGAWRDMRPAVLNLAVRVQQMWQTGGLSFKIPSETSRKPWNEREDVNMLLDLIKKSDDYFQRLPPELVTIDEDGLHMETKTSCHAFFGDLLKSLKKAPGFLYTPKQHITKTLRGFCKIGAVDSEYCRDLFAEVK